MKSMRKLAYVACGLALAATVAFTAVPAQAAAPKKYVKKITKVTVNGTAVKKGKTVYLDKGHKATVKATVTVKGKASKKVTYKSSRKSVATISKKGVISPKKAGTTTITVTTKGKTKKGKKISFSFKGKVYTKFVTPKYGATELYRMAGANATTTLKATPTNIKVKNITVKSSNKKVVSVKKKKATKKYVSYTLTGKKAGKATITVSAKGTHKTTQVIKVYDSSLTAKADATTLKVEGGVAATTKLNVTLKNLTPSETKVTSSDSAVVEVSGKDTTWTLTGKKAGKATITVEGSKKGVKGSCKQTIEITVQEYPVTALTLADDTTVKATKIHITKIDSAEKLLADIQNIVANVLDGDVTISINNTQYKVVADKAGKVTYKNITKDGTETELKADALEKKITSYNGDVTVKLPVTPSAAIKALSTVSLKNTYSVAFNLGGTDFEVTNIACASGKISFTTEDCNYEVTASGSTATVKTTTANGKAFSATKLYTALKSNTTVLK